MERKKALMTSQKMTSYQLALCMVNYNGEQYLEGSLGSVFDLKEKLNEIILIDNASADGSLKIVKERFPTVKVIQLNENRGPATARNKGFKPASSDLILFMDNDVSLTPACPDRLVQELSRHPSAALAVPRVLYSHNKNTVQYDGADSHYLGLMTLHHHNFPVENLTDLTRKISSLVTTCFIVDRSKLGNGDPFDNSFFIYFEDRDLGLRTRILGYDILAVPSAWAYHGAGTKGLSLRASGRYAKKRVFCLIRNRWLVILKNYQFKTLLVLFPIFFLYEIFQFAGVIKKGWFAQWLRALFWIMMHHAQILQKRRIVQRERQTPDREILKGGPIPFTKQLAKGVLESTSIRLLDRLAEVYWAKFERYI